MFYTGTKDEDCANADLVVDARKTAAERDRLKAVNAELLKALKLANSWIWIDPWSRTRKECRAAKIVHWAEQSHRQGRGGKPMKTIPDFPKALYGCVVESCAEERFSLSHHDLWWFPIHRRNGGTPAGTASRALMNSVFNT